MKKTVSMLLEYGKQALKVHPLPTLEAQLLLGKVLDCTREKLYAYPEKLVSEQEEGLFLDLLHRRVAHEPMAYLLGVKEFWSLTFEVTRDTLIPRLETECLVEFVLEQYTKKTMTVLELGTGCGNIACALAYMRPSWNITAVDISAPALIIAKRNAHRLALDNITFLQSNWLNNVPQQCFDIIIGNPPYIREYDLHLRQEELAFEPRVALTPGKNGLEAYRTILETGVPYLKPQGRFIFEHGFDQGAALRHLLASMGLTEIQTICDLSAHERVSFATKK